MDNYVKYGINILSDQTNMKNDLSEWNKLRMFL